MFLAPLFLLTINPRISLINQQLPTTTTQSAKAELKVTDVKTGTGDEVKDFDQVTVDYTGTLANGTKFDSSVGKAPFTFIVGLSQVIPGWDKGLLGMKVGGERKLVVPPDLAYGEQGAGDGVIPPNSTLNFTIELHKVSDPIKELKIKTETKGTGTAAKKGDQVQLELVLSLKDGKIVADNTGAKPPIKLNLGFSNVFPGLTLGLVGMQVGAVRTVEIPPDLAFKDVENGPVPANSTLYLRVALLGDGTNETKVRPDIKPFVPPVSKDTTTGDKKDGTKTGTGTPTDSGNTGGSK